MSAYIVAGIGQAYSVSECSALEPGDKDLWKRAYEGGVLEALHERGGCTMPSAKGATLLGEAWIAVGQCEEHKLNADEAVIAYCMVLS